MGLVSAEGFRDNLRRVRDAIDAALERSGRAIAAAEGSVSVMAVTKGFGREAGDLAAAAGVRLLGENRVQEAEGKYGTAGAPAELHLIGHLQTNKARKAAALFACVQSIDRFETAQALDRHASALGREMRILLELNTSGEESKSGYRDRGALLLDLDRIKSLRSLKPAGLMTVGPLGGDERAVRRSFALLKSLFDEARSRGDLPDFSILSMGMSGDYVMAVEEGATMVRIGTALFGERSQ